MYQISFALREKFFRALHIGVVGNPVKNQNAKRKDGKEKSEEDFQEIEEVFEEANLSFRKYPGICRGIFVVYVFIFRTISSIL
jgi:hypothetical protein